MKRIDLHFEVDGQVKQTQNCIEKMVEILLKDEIKILFIELDCTLVQKKDDCYAFLNWFKKFSEEKAEQYNSLIKVSVIITPNCISSKIIKLLKRWARLVQIIETDDLKSIVKSCGSFSESKVDYNLLLKASDFKSICKKYEKYKKFHIPVAVGSNFNDYTMQIVNYFEQWAFDLEGTDISIFSNLLSSMLLGYEGDSCLHSSCLGRNVYLCNDDMYFCKWDKSSSYLGKVTKIFELKDIFSSEQFFSILSNEIQNREQCKSECLYYRVCHNGCPLKEKMKNIGCVEDNYVDIYIKIAKRMKEIISIPDYSVLNPFLRVKILSTISNGNGFSYLEVMLQDEN